MIRVNLLPIREERRKAGVRQELILIGLSLLLSVVGVAGYHVMLRSQIAGVKARNVQLDAQLARYKEQLAQVEAFRTKKADIEAKLEVIQGLERARAGPVHMLDELSTRAPDRLWVTLLDASGDTVHLEGMSLDNERLARFLTALEESDYFGGVELEKSEFRDIGGLKLAQFELSASLTHPETDDAPSEQPTPPASAGR